MESKKANCTSTDHNNCTRPSFGMAHREKLVNKEKMQLQRKTSTDRSFTEIPSIVREVIDSPGRPMNSNIRNYMEERFNYDFSNVKIHTDRSANRSARAINAFAYTMNNNIVFDEGQYKPMTIEGKKLLAHELTHVVQQATSRMNFINTSAKTINRNENLEREADTVSESITNDKPISLGRLSVPSNNILRQPQSTNIAIRQIDVNQTTNQTVTIMWDDGVQESDECSTGKGHCCFDESITEGGVCSDSGSRKNNSNCTPTGRFRVTWKARQSRGGVPFWTQFDGRGIALHQYTPVDGTPLSHGCVRLNRSMAQKIYEHSIVGETVVIVRNLAQPHCDNENLQAEWMNDFRTAGATPPDGERIDPETGQRRSRRELRDRRRRQRSIARERSVLRSALNVNESELDNIVGNIRSSSINFSSLSSNSRTKLLTHIPRCIPTVTTEENRIDQAVDHGVINLPSHLQLFNRRLNRSRNLRGARRIISRMGRQIWREATSRSRNRSGELANTDDRILYWERLQLSRPIRSFEPRWIRRLNPDRKRRVRQQLLQNFERTSRGMSSIQFNESAEIKRILISGFDPFGLHQYIGRGNPSGAAILALDNRTITNQGANGHIQGVIFPVRYADFNEGIVETFFSPFLNSSSPPDMIMTISQGGSTNFEVEEWSGRRRSSQFPDNLGVSSGGTDTNPLEPNNITPGSEFIQTTLPKQAIRTSLGRDDVLSGESERISLNSRAIRGSGGGYLSNEIFYRTSLLRVNSSNSSLPVGHLHTPYLDAPINYQSGEFQSQRDSIVSTIENILRSTLPDI